MRAAQSIYHVRNIKLTALLLTADPEASLFPEKQFISLLLPSFMSNFNSLSFFCSQLAPLASSLIFKPNADSLFSFLSRLDATLKSARFVGLLVSQFLTLTFLRRLLGEPISSLFLSIPTLFG